MKPALKYLPTFGFVPGSLSCGVSSEKVPH
jgi:hypothetical protein